MERWLAFRCRLSSACLARLVACAEFAKVLLLPVIRKTAYYADFAGNCQWLAGYSGCAASFSPYRREGREVIVSDRQSTLQFCVNVCVQAGEVFLYKRLFFFASSASLRLS
jgi:hypothetical protein